MVYFARKSFIYKRHAAPIYNNNNDIDVCGDVTSAGAADVQFSHT
jgi:hypothetical protein